MTKKRGRLNLFEVFGVIQSGEKKNENEKKNLDQICEVHQKDAVRALLLGERGANGTLYRFHYR